MAFQHDSLQHDSFQALEGAAGGAAPTTIEWWVQGVERIARQGAITALVAQSFVSPPFSFAVDDAPAAEALPAADATFTRTTFYQAKAEPVYVPVGAPPETVTIDKWLSYPVMPAAARQPQIPSFVLGDVPRVPFLFLREPVTVPAVRQPQFPQPVLDPLPRPPSFGWFHREPVTVPGARQPQIPTYVLGDLPRTPSFAWFLREPTRIDRARQPDIPAFVLGDLPRTPSIAWLTHEPYGVFRVRLPQTPQPVLDPYPLPPVAPPETITVDKWTNYSVGRIDRARQPQIPSAPAYGAPPIAPVAPTVTMDMWTNYSATIPRGRDFNFSLALRLSQGGVMDPYPIPPITPPDVPGLNNYVIKYRRRRRMKKVWRH